MLCWAVDKIMHTKYLEHCTQHFPLKALFLLSFLYQEKEKKSIRVLEKDKMKLSGNVICQIK